MGLMAEFIKTVRDSFIFEEVVSYDSSHGARSEVKVRNMVAATYAVADGLHAVAQAIKDHTAITTGRETSSF